MKKSRSRPVAPPGAPARAHATGSQAPPVRPPSLEQSIGAYVRLQRRRLNMTVSELAATASISPGMMSKIENGQISASLATLQALAAALNQPLTAFFAAFEDTRDSSFVKAGRGVTIERRGTKVGHQYRLLGHSLSGDTVIEPYLITLSEEAVPYTAFQHEGVEFIYMLSGRLAYRHADKSFELEPGDALMFDAKGAHGPERLIEKPMTYLSIIVYPKR